MPYGKVMFSSANEVWETPQDFYDKLDAEFHFNLDPCANDDNHKCERYFTKEQDGLKQNWGGVLGLLQSSLWPCAKVMGKMSR